MNTSNNVKRRPGLLSCELECTTPGLRGLGPPLASVCDSKGSRSRCLHRSSGEHVIVDLYMANLNIVVTSPGTRRRSLMTTVPRIITLLASFVAHIY